MRRDLLWSRRRLLAGVGGLGVTGLAGCTGDDGASSETPTRDSAFESIEFEGQHLVIQLRENHDVSGVNVIGPDGSLFAQQGVAVGETRVAIEMLDPRSGISDHYTNGTHEVIAISGESQESVELQLAPDIRITDVSQYTDGDSDGELARLLVSVENTGSAPAWITDFAIRGAPNWTTNEKLNGGSGVPSFVDPENPSEALIGAGKSLKYVPYDLPFLFEDAPSACDQALEVTLLAGVSDGSQIEVDLRVSYGGDLLYVGGHGESVCSEITMSLTDQTHSQESLSDWRRI